MIRIKERIAKRTRMQITYEFDFESAVHTRKTTFPLKAFNSYTEKEVVSRVRGLANIERRKLGRSKDKKSDDEKEE